MSIEKLETRLHHLKKKIAPPVRVVLSTRWGDDLTPVPPGTIVFKTVWGPITLEDEEEELHGEFEKPCKTG